MYISIKVDGKLYTQLKKECKKDKLKIGEVCGLLLNKGMLEELNRHLRQEIDSKPKEIKAIDI